MKKIIKNDNLDDLWNKKVEVVCPECGEIYLRTIEKGYINSKDAWKRNSYLVILCNGCRK